MKSDYLENVKRQIENYKTIGEKYFVQLPDEKLFWQYNENSNSIASIVKHLWGNMLSRWTNFLTSDGETEWGTRHDELNKDIQSRKELVEKWNEGWNCFLNSINALSENDLMRKVSIRRQVHTVTEAIDIQLAHYSYCIGQIVFIHKLISENTSPLTPKNNSQKNNVGKNLSAKPEVPSIEKYLREGRNKFNTTP